MKRPEPPTRFVPNHEGYYQHNRYFNEAEKYMTYLENIIADMSIEVTPTEETNVKMKFTVVDEQ